MKVTKSLVFIAWFLLPAIPAALYAASVGGFPDAYSVSVALGAYAYALLAAQPALAARPAFIVKAIGAKGSATLHGVAPVLALGLAAAHRALKLGLGFEAGTTQAVIGAASFWFLVAASVAAVILLAAFGGALGKALKPLRAWVAERLGLNYKAARAAHGLAALAVVALFVHLSLASSSDLSFNPAGPAWLAAWTLVSFGVYARSRLSARRAGKASR